MNREAMLAVADVIEYADRFDMSTLFERRGECYLPHWRRQLVEGELWEDCSTAGCVAGWTLAWAEPSVEAFQYDSVIGVAAKELGLTPAQSSRLFQGHVPGLSFKCRNGKKAAKVLRDIANGVIEL